MTNENNRAGVVFAEVFGLASVFLQWLPTFWTINHLKTLISRIRGDDVKTL
jgi:hypothetical protein